MPARFARLPHIWRQPLFSKLVVDDKGTFYRMPWRGYRPTNVRFTPILETDGSWPSESAKRRFYLLPEPPPDGYGAWLFELEQELPELPELSEHVGVGLWSKGESGHSWKSYYWRGWTPQEAAHKIRSAFGLPHPHTW